MSLGSFLHAVVDKLHAAAVKVEGIFVEIFGQQAAQEFGSAALNLLKSNLGQIVVAEVEALAGVSDISGVQKAAQAQAAILDKAKALGISTSTSIVNMLIELAVQFVSGKLVASTIPVSTAS